MLNVIQIFGILQNFGPHILNALSVDTYLIVSSVQLRPNNFNLIYVFSYSTPIEL